ncbi:MULTISPECIES: hypothetical protein [unclassified Marinobacter]|jgi:hypothetical protein|uniref:hypothetical protein n=1 Tax=unclassified Marinobacter TaxID=83889 RepID=UPI00200DDA89|nr:MULTISPECIES: hypothetical protein [unclassified Marinobacter]MCL1476772.1 hypothetical protein [Marinobacter sp.]MCL1479872.1 hypothetical protein [Marinobacter sp.]MCL1484987.1 hypothetical protein [Marinobacter sp.]MCL1488065.1 hypothetical protein [Marinobacter sp.]UQG57300.1 hypothetical protein MIH16_06570 [Marinobacter sp. M4C]
MIKLQSLITEYDDSLSGDSYIDPLGQLVIWSAFGQKIFNSRVNSVSNDVRNFTLNLLHHGVIRSILQDESVTVSPALAAAVGDKESLPFIHACLIYLENIFTYSMVDKPEEVDIDTLGILGGSNGRRAMEESDQNPSLLFTDKKEGHLLVRQLGLGVSGRYKTPFVEMGFFDHSYRYSHQKSEEKWGAFNTLLDNHSELRDCFEQAKAHIIDLLNVHYSKAQIPPRRQFRDVPVALRDAYRNAFSTQGKVGVETKAFWLDVTGLNKGAAGALLVTLEDHYAAATGEKLVPRIIFVTAEERCEVADERRKLQLIQIVEPLLAELDLLFRLARHKKVQSVRDVRGYWESLGRTDQTLRDAAARIWAAGDLLPTLQGTARRRLQKLLDVAVNGNVEDQLQGLLKYHAQIMKTRGQLRWLEATPGGEIRLYGRTEPLPKTDNRANGSWANTYYIYQFYNLVSGYQGGAR